MIDIKFNENPSSGSWVAPRGRTGTTQLTADLQNSVNAPKKWQYS